MYDNAWSRTILYGHHCYQDSQYGHHDGNLDGQYGEDGQLMVIRMNQMLISFRMVEKWFQNDDRDILDSHKYIQDGHIFSQEASMEDYF